MKKKLFAAVLLISAAFRAFSFEWPQLISDYSSIYMYFGQNVGQGFSSSLVFSGKTPVHVSEKGTVLITLSENSPGVHWPYHPAGNAVILAHADNLISLYGNLAQITALKQPADQKDDVLEAGAELGSSGGSGWHLEKSTFSFQAADIQNKCVINPLILLPALENPPDIGVKGIQAVDRKGAVFDLDLRKTLPQGMYVLYADISTVMPLSTQVLHNGSSVETISYDMLRQTAMYICAAGKKMYSGRILYQRPGKKMLAELLLTRGKNTISISASTASGTVKTVSFLFDVL